MANTKNQHEEKSWVVITAGIFITLQVTTNHWVTTLP